MKFFVSAFIFVLLSLPRADAYMTFRNDYSSVNVDTTTPLQIFASSSAPVIRVSIFDSSGKTLELLVGGVRALLIPPGGLDASLGINQGALIELRAVSATASSGEIDVNFF